MGQRRATYGQRMAEWEEQKDIRDWTHSMHLFIEQEAKANNLFDKDDALKHLYDLIDEGKRFGYPFDDFKDHFFVKQFLP